MKKLQMVLAVAVGATISAGAAAALATPEHRSGHARSQAAAVPGPPTYQSAPEMQYVPVAPCRIVDTRLGGGPISTNASRTFYVTGTVGFPTSGGKSGGCGIPAGASAAAISVTTTASSGIGYLTLYAEGITRPLANQTSFRAGVDTTTQANAPLGSSTGRVSVYASNRTQVVMDVSGYYIKPMAGFISPLGNPYAGSSRILSATRVADPGVYDVQFDREIRYCSAVATAYYYGYYASTDPYGTASADTVRVRIFNNNGVGVNEYFSITVTC